MTMQAQIEELLQRTIGLDAASIGTAAVERAVRARMARLSANDPSDYWSHLQTSKDELNQLIEAVVVPETWFFRDREPFAALSRFALEEWLPAHASGSLRLLSAPCATGEEPYSTAMALLSAGLPPQRFEIDAVDISAEALAQAKRAVYGRNSFRGKALDFRDRYFQVTPEGHALHETVRRQVRFQKANLAVPEFLPLSERYDVIFCRNVLIYFDGPTQERVIKTLHRLLTPDGILFVGHAEAGLFVETDFVSAKLPMAFAFRRARLAGGPVPKNHLLPGSISAQPSWRALVKDSSIPTSSLSQRARGTRPPALPTAPSAQREGAGWSARSSGAASPVAITNGLSLSEAELDRAARLADAGKLEEAARLCESHLGNHGASAPAYYLLGVIRDAKGDKQRADECYRKTIYLEPDHYQALLQLALLAEQSGERHDASQWHHRARRVKERSKAL